MLEDMFASGHIADLVLLVMAIEAAIVAVLLRSGRIILPFRTYMFGVIAGGCIVLALRQALTGGFYLLIALALGLSFIAHMAELFSLVRRSNGDPNHAGSSYKSRSINRT